MPGLSGRVGGRAQDDAARVSSRLQHFPFYETAVIGDDAAWLGWTGVGRAGRHLLRQEDPDVLVGYHGDGVDGVEPVRAAAHLEKVMRLAADSPLGLAESLDGSFAAARYEVASGELTLVTDPFGHRRVYYLVRDGALYFAPELKGLLAWSNLELAADPEGLRDFMNYSYPLGDRTSLAGVKVLPPASVLRFRGGDLRVETYWHPRYEPVEGDDDELVARGYELFARSFGDKVAPGRPVVVPVSGGVDSRLLLAETLRRGHEPLSYTYGHAGSREAQVALEVMAACDVGDRFIVLDDFPDPVDCLQTGSWFVEGMANVSTFALVGVNHHLLGEDRSALFLNGIYGGPTNFSNAYHKPAEMVRDMPLEEKVRRTAFTMTGRRDGAVPEKILSADFGRTCAEAYYPELEAAFLPWQDVSPEFGHQKDAFLVANRMFRFMNQVDLNRYYWDNALPLTSFSLYRFYLQLPDRVKFDRLLHRRIVAREFPEVANVTNFNSGRTVTEELAGAPPEVRSGRSQRIRHLLGRLTRGAYSTADPESYQAASHYLRRNRALREFVGDMVHDPGFLSADVCNRELLRDYYEKTLRGADLAVAVYRMLTWELWLRQIKAGRREVA